MRRLDALMGLAVLLSCYDLLKWIYLIDGGGGVETGGSAPKKGGTISRKDMGGGTK